MAVHEDQRRLIISGEERVVGSREFIEVVGARHLNDFPAIRIEPLRHVLGEGDVRVAVDGHIVVVEDPAQVRELQVSRK